MIRQETVIIAVLLVILVCIIPRRFLMLPFVVAACLVPADQRIIIMGLDFTILRILVVAGVLRMTICQEVRDLKPNICDIVLVAWVACGAVVYVLQWADLQAIIYKCGLLFDVLGLYWVFRQSLRSWEDVRFTFTVLALCVIAMVPLVAFESATGQNPFTILGRVGTVVRGEQYRCQACFPHSIILGLFWATLFPVFIGLAKAGRKKYLYWAAAAGTVFIVFATASSTPIGVLVAMVLLVALFRYRFYGRQIAYAVLGMVVLLHVIMKAPVWHLISRIKIVSGSTGYHRYKLIDEAIQHFGEWALLGTRSTAHWGWGLEDITNQYVREGVTGGLVTLLLFVILLVIGATTVGKYSLRTTSHGQRWLAWGICVSFLGHCISFLGVSYFGQIRMLLYLTFAVVSLIHEISANHLQWTENMVRNSLRKAV